MGIDVAIDLGTSRTRIFLQNKGIVVDHPSVITINLENDSVVAVGQQAYVMLGRTSSKMEAIYPLSGGVISDLELAEEMISLLLHSVVSSKIGMPRAIASVPGEITEVEKRAVVNSISGAGIRRVCLIEDPVAAAIGATTDMAVISLGGISVSRTIKHAGNAMDDEIIKYVRNKYNMLIGKRTAEEAKIKIGCVLPGVIKGTHRIKGRNLVTGMPCWVDLEADEMAEPLAEPAQVIVEQVQDILEETPPELTGDIYSDGIVLTGGGSQLAGLDLLIQRATNLKVRIADDPSTCVVRGCGEAIKYIDRLGKNDSGVNPITDQY